MGLVVTRNVVDALCGDRICGFADARDDRARFAPREWLGHQRCVTGVELVEDALPISRFAADQARSPVRDLLSRSVLDVRAPDLASFSLVPREIDPVSVPRPCRCILAAGPVRDLSWDASASIDRPDMPVSVLRLGVERDLPTVGCPRRRTLPGARTMCQPMRFRSVRRGSPDLQGIARSRR